jgi:ferredoxin-NADP reductase
MPLEPWRTAIVIRIEDATPITKRYWIEVPELARFQFKAGQFVTLDLPISEKKNQRWRSYSISSAPDHTNVFELIIVLDPHGVGTQYIFSNIHVGSELLFRGPQGVFTLRQPLEKDVFFVCTGTGIAPFRSMLWDIKNNNIPHKNIHLVFGCRTQSDLLYYDEMKAFEKETEDFHYIPALSREQWHGRSGYVHPVYEELCTNKQPASFYLCGWKGMLDEAKKRILAMGYERKDIHVEVYG